MGVPRENMHIHHAENTDTPTLPEVILSLHVKICYGVDETVTCAICHEGYSDDDEMASLPCEHAYHRSCIVPWLQKHNTCPTCRHELPSKKSQSKKKPIVMVGEESSTSSPMQEAQEAS